MTINFEIYDDFSSDLEKLIGRYKNVYQANTQLGKECFENDLYYLSASIFAKAIYKKYKASYKHKIGSVVKNKLESEIKKIIDKEFAQKYLNKKEL